MASSLDYSSCLESSVLQHYGTSKRTVEVVWIAKFEVSGRWEQFLLISQIILLHN